MSDAPMKPGSSFLDRWSRRKRGHADEPDAKPAGARGVRDSAVSPSASDAAVPRDRLPAGGAEDPNPTGTHASAMSIEASLPGVDDLTAESDVTGFLKQGVSEELKRLALRRIWSLDPQIRDFIEVAENQYNWTFPAVLPGMAPLRPAPISRRCWNKPRALFRKSRPSAKTSTRMLPVGPIPSTSWKRPRPI